MTKFTLLIALLVASRFTNAQTLTITAVNTKTPAEFVKSSQRLLAVLNGETRADSTQKQDSTLSIIIFAKGVKAEISKEEYNRVLDLYASKHKPVVCDCYDSLKLASQPINLRQYMEDQQKTERINYFIAAIGAKY